MENYNNLTIYWTSDLHNKKKVFSFLEKLPRDRNTLLLDTGDAIGGGSILFYPQESILEKMSCVGYQAMALGNREFHYSKSIIKERIQQADFPVISSNLENTIQRLEGLHAHIKVKTNDIEIGILGLTPIQFKNTILIKLTRMRFLGYQEAIARFTKLLKDTVDLFIVLSHAGLEEDKKWLQSFNCPLIVLSGHSHKTLAEPIKINNSYIFSIGAYGKFVGKLELEIDKSNFTNPIKNFKYEPIKTKDIRLQT